LFSRQAGGGDRTDIRRRSSHAAPEQGRNIDSKYFSYQSHYVNQWPDADDPAPSSARTWPVRLCAKEIESELTEPLHEVARSCKLDVVSAYCPNTGQQR